MDLNCNKCGKEAVYSEEYDAYYCDVCDAWLEDVCTDYECNYCNGRPENPSHVNLNT